MLVHFTDTLYCLELVEVVFLTLMGNMASMVNLRLKDLLAE